MKRRNFVQSMLASAGAMSIAPTFAIGKSGTPPSSTVNIAMIGCGGVVKWNLGWLKTQNIVAMCDVDYDRAAEGFNTFPNAKRFKDFRVMFDKMGKDIDAVHISTPDHVHFPAAIAAMERGIHVFVQKPATHDIWQCRTLLKAARKYNVVTQMGNQGHITDGIRMFKEWYDADVLGDVEEIIAWTDRASWAMHNPIFANPNGTETPHAALDWDLWLCTARHHNFSKQYHPGSWRFHWDFGSGALGDIGCHTLDTPLWAMDLPMPSKIDMEIDKSVKWGNCNVTYHFPARGKKPPVKIKWYEGRSSAPVDYLPAPKTKAEKEGGLIMIGSKHTAYHYDMRPISPKILMPNEEWREFRRTLPRKTIPRIKGDIRDDWVRGITEGTTPCSNFEVSTKLTEMTLLGVVAQRAGHSITWDEKNLTVPGHPELDNIIKQPHRKGWKYGEDLW